MEEEEEESQRIEPKEDRVLKQLKKIQADISIWGLLMSYYEHRNSFFKTLGKAKVPIDITLEGLVGLIMASKTLKPTIAFTDKDLPPEGLAHNKPLYISLKCLTKWIPLLLVDNGSALNVCPQRTLNKLGVSTTNIRPSSPGVRGYDNSKRRVVGAVPSTLHQKVKFVVDERVVTILGDSSIRAHSVTPVQEVGTEETFLIRFSLKEANVMQAFMAERNFYISPPAIRMMKKQNYFPRFGLGKRSQGIRQMIDPPHNQYTFGLGYTPTEAEIENKRNMEKAKAKGSKVKEEKFMIPKTLNGWFVREGEDFPFCGSQKHGKMKPLRKSILGCKSSLINNGLIVTWKKNQRIHPPYSKTGSRC
ncbi:hypothetical protein RHMOL_Rhmol11G0060600 [Rhododendron molle]|uniref:Uncharacterized protein n=1 Tax=Rhododendron molle TaxID=49168 RepID=A0ACC0LQ47_RHOML|nr:hypothetical protein RHMOL_Rhmol11G0060600 [Rhododendron molle]